MMRDIMTNASLIAAQDQLPDVNIHIKSDGQIDTVSLKEWAAGRKIVLFAVPGAFTPTCSAKHLPEYVVECDALKAKGVDAIACLSVNDAHVMDAWGQANNVNGIEMMADPLGEASQALGIFVVNAPALGNTRAARMALIADDGVVTHVFMEEPGVYEVSSPAHVMANL